MRDNENDNNPSLPGLLWRYKDKDIIVAYKVRFVFYFCLVCIITISLVFFYSIILQKTNALYKSLYYPILIALLTGLSLFVMILILLIRGYSSLASNLLIIIGTAIVWTVIYSDISDPIIKLDSVVYIFVFISMVPIIVNRSSLLLITYVLINIPILFFIVFSQRDTLHMTYPVLNDYLADVTVSLIAVCIIVWNVFSINRSVFQKLKADILKKECDEKKLIYSKDRISSLLRFQNEMLETASVWINTLDVDGNVVTWNKAAERISGYSKEEVLGNRKIWEWVYPDENYRNSIFSKMTELTNKGVRLENFETEICRKDGEKRYISWNSNNLINENGQPVGSISIGSDITEHKLEQVEKEKLEAQMMQIQKIDSIGRLAGGIAHDFNNLLTAILGTTELALHKLKPEDSFFHNFTLIKDASESAANLTRQLLLFSRRQIVDPKVINLNEVMEHMRSMLIRMIGENIDFRIIPYKNLCRIKADTGQIEQVIINLVVNARDAMPDGGILTLETSNIVFDDNYCRHHPYILPGEYVMFSVSDSGCGISRKIQEHIYEPFFTTKEAGKGTGLGLSTVYGVVKQSGGSIELYSEEGHGTTFKIYFPCVKDTTAASFDQQYSDDIPDGDETILIVEDNSYVLDFIKTTITQLNYKVIPVTSGEDAIHVSGEFDGIIHLLLTDVILPGMNGRAVADEILKTRPGIKVLYISGYTGDLISRSGILEKGLHFISKPFSSVELAHKIRSILDQKSG